MAWLKRILATAFFAPLVVILLGSDCNPPKYENCNIDGMVLPCFEPLECISCGHGSGKCAAAGSTCCGAGLGSLTCESGTTCVTCGGAAQCVKSGQPTECCGSAPCAAGEECIRGCGPEVCKPEADNYECCGAGACQKDQCCELLFCTRFVFGTSGDGVTPITTCVEYQCSPQCMDSCADVQDCEIP